jgi:hypothetical protein
MLRGKRRYQIIHAVELRGRAEVVNNPVIVRAVT